VGRQWGTELVDSIAVTRLELGDRPGLRAEINALRELGDDCCLVAVKRDRILRDLEGMRVIQRLIHPRGSSRPALRSTRTPRSAASPSRLTRTPRSAASPSG
jgi:hypothetical protein